MVTRTHRTHRRRWLALGVLVVPVLLTSMDISILYMAVPAITADLAPTAGQMLWILDAYGFLLAGLLITAGNIGDRIGRRRLLLIGSVLFGAASLAAALSPTPEALIAARALMGVGGATLMPSTLALIRNIFTDPAERTRAIGLWTAGFAGGAALGPIVGGGLLEFFGWGSVFLINVPIILALLVAGVLVLPEYRAERPDPLDTLSVLLSFTAVLPLVWAIKTTAEELALSPAGGAALLFGLLTGAVFVLRQRRLAVPLVDVSLFANRRFTGAVLAGALMMFSLVAMMLHTAQFLQLVEGFSPLGAAFLLLPVLAAVAVTSTLSATAARLWSYRTVFVGGALTSASGMLVLGFTPAAPPIWWVLLGSALVGMGVGPVVALAVDVVVAAVSPDRAGAASAVSETANEFGAAMGIAVLGTVSAAAYRAGIQAQLPDGVPAERAEAISSSLGAALAVAEHLPTGAAESLAASAREAFVSGMAATGMVGAALLLALGLGLIVLLRQK
ncbi:MFS transporter [Nocardiopsis valliformis]|uniref:MFS transporter n=1 Tax=Nocardiopsis valliformis TaxID=239974 RepID=UPI00034A909A|nr:MFS transporter [Nocardiopsis valliformis]